MTSVSVSVYEPIDPQDLKDFALLNLQGIPRSKAANIFLIQAVSFASIVEGPIEACIIANCPEKELPSATDPRWQWYLTEPEALEMMRVLVEAIAKQTPT